MPRRRALQKVMRKWLVELPVSANAADSLYVDATGSWEARRRALPQFVERGYDGKHAPLVTLKKLRAFKVR